MGQPISSTVECCAKCLVLMECNLRVFYLSSFYRLLNLQALIIEYSCPVHLPPCLRNYHFLFHTFLWQRKKHDQYVLIYVHHDILSFWSKCLSGTCVSRDHHSFMHLEVYFVMTELRGSSKLPEKRSILPAFLFKVSFSVISMTYGQPQSKNSSGKFQN